MPTQRDLSRDYSLFDWVKDYIRESKEKKGRVYLGLVHRLDRPVPGAMVMARTSKAAARLSRAFKERHVEKIYWAVVLGRPEPEMGEVVHFIKKDSKGTSRVSMASGKEARLLYKTLETKEKTSLLEVIPITGRHHQIRVQLAHLGCPIVNDFRYGKVLTPGGCIGLWCRTLKVPHPTKGNIVEISSPTPKGWPW